MRRFSRSGGIQPMGLEYAECRQLWKTYQVLGALCECQGELGGARAAYRSAMEVIEGVAVRLQNQELRRTFLHARPVQELRAHLIEMEPA
jgi:hypothetical protein